MKRFRLVIPIMTVVAILATWYLNKEYSEVPLATRILITAGGVLVSGAISYFLLRNDDNIHKIDPKPKPTDLNKKKR